MKMKKLYYVFITLLISVLISCKNETKTKDTIANETTLDTIQENKTEEKTNNKSNTATFDINTIPISNVELGEFPFFSLPKGLQTTNKPIKKSFDVIYFPIDSVMTPLEGRIWKSYIRQERNSDEDWSLRYFEKSYDEAIIAVGGVKIFDGKITNDEYKRYHDQATYLGEDGSIGYVGETIKVYVIRRPNGDDIYIQLSGDTASGKLNILQKEAFKQTIMILKSDQIQKDLDEKGKAVLHINFDTDKATLKPDGKDAVAEISKVLQANPSLKISINGYTDNTGNNTRNIQLSKDRAETVKKAIITSGIESARLSSDGFGSKNPISDNNSEEGRAQNRRVELIKK